MKSVRLHHKHNYKYDIDSVFRLSETNIQMRSCVVYVYGEISQLFFNMVLLFIQRNHNIDLWV